MLELRWCRAAGLRRGAGGTGQCKMLGWHKWLTSLSTGTKQMASGLRVASGMARITAPNTASTRVHSALET